MYEEWLCAESTKALHSLWLELSWLEGLELTNKHKVTGKMNAPHVPRALCVCITLSLLITASVASVNTSDPQPPVPEDDVLENKKIELFDGVSVKIPKSEDRDRKMLSLEINTGKDVETGKFIINNNL